MDVDRNGFTASLKRCVAKSAIIICPSTSSNAEPVGCWHVIDVSGIGCVDLMSKLPGMLRSQQGRIRVTDMLEV